MVGTALSRRDVGTRLAGTGAALLRRRLDELERRVGVLALGALGCRVCRDWGAVAVIYPEEPAFEPVDGAPRYCRPWARPADGQGAEEEDSGWPESLVCGVCGRRPEHVVNIRYAEEGTWRTGYRPLSSWRQGDTS